MGLDPFSKFAHLLASHNARWRVGVVRVTKDGWPVSAYIHHQDGWHGWDVIVPARSNLFRDRFSQSGSQTLQRILTALCRLLHQGGAGIAGFALRAGVAPALVDPVGHQAVDQHRFEAMAQGARPPVRRGVPTIGDLVVIENHTDRKHREDLAYAIIARPGLLV